VDQTRQEQLETVILKDEMREDAQIVKNDQRLAKIRDPLQL
jgi:hypothetical protein